LIFAVQRSMAPPPGIS